MDTTNQNLGHCMSQEKKILSHMYSGGRITPIDALRFYGCERLAARIADIRRKGHDVKSEFVTTPSGKRVKAYWIEDKYKVTL